MIIGDTFELFGHNMEVMVRKESLDLVRYDLMCKCCAYPRNLIMEVTEKDLNSIKEICKESYFKKERIRDE